MSNEVIKIEKAESDLELFDCNCVVESYSERLGKIVSQIERAKGGGPSANMQPIRKMTLSVSGETTIMMLEVLSNDIRSNFGIDCFQISLDRKNCKAYMLFDWYNSQEGHCRYIYKSLQKKIEVMVMQHLLLPCNSKNDELLRLYLKNAYRHNKNIYKNLLEKVGNTKMGKGSYQLLEIIINYVELVCQGKVK